MYAIQPPVLQYTDLDGEPLENGKIYIGTVNLNPETNPITVYWDAAGTQPAAQPIETVDGYPSRDGSPANIYAASSYSITVRDKKMRMVYNFTSGGSGLFQFIIDLASSAGSALVGFIQAGAGAVLRTLQSKLREIVSVKDYGAIGDGVADDTSAIQAAITALQGTGGQLYFPKGTYKITSSLNVGGSIGFLGETRYGVSLAWTNTALSVFLVASDTQVSFEKFTFSGPLAAVSGAVISLTGAATQNLFSYFRDCTFSQGYSHIVTTSAADWTIENCSFTNYLQYGVFVADDYNPDAGDSFIGSSTFSTTSTTASAIGQKSSGGLKIVGNKILGGAYGYRLVLATVAPSTIDLIISANSIENQVVAAVDFERTSGALTFGNIAVTSNQISNSPLGVTCDANAGWLSRMVIAGNQITLPAANGTCISLGSPSDFLIDGNGMFGQSGATFGIAIGVGATKGIIGVNQYDGITDKINNGAPASVFVTNNVTQSGTSGAFNTSTAYGTLFYGSIAVVFANAYDEIPTVQCTPANFSSGIAAWPSAISKTGFTMNVIGASNVNGTAKYDAQGVF